MIFFEKPVGVEQGLGLYTHLHYFSYEIITPFITRSSDQHMNWSYIRGVISTPSKLLSTLYFLSSSEIFMCKIVIKRQKKECE